MFDITILIQYFRYWGQEPVDIDREAIKRYLMTDESWVQHRWMAIRRTFQLPFSISFHEGRCRRHKRVLEGSQPADPIDETALPGKLSNKEEAEEEWTALLGRTASDRSYGT